MYVLKGLLDWLRFLEEHRQLEGRFHDRSGAPPHVPAREGGRGGGGRGGGGQATATYPPGDPVVAAAPLLLRGRPRDLDAGATVRGQQPDVAHPPPLDTRKSDVCTMGCCGKKKLLMIMTSVCACASFAFLCIAIATDYWLYAIEKVVNENLTAEYMKTYNGLWRKCLIDDGPSTMWPTVNIYTDLFTEKYSHNQRCSYINYFKHIDRDGLGPTEAILLSMRRSTLFPLISLLILLVGEIVCFLGHCNHKKKVLTFVAGILFVVGGLCNLVGIILYIGAITEEAGNKSKSQADEPRFQHWYGSSFLMSIASFIVSELTGVFSVYLYISRHKHAYRKKQQERMSMMEANERPHHSRYRRSRSHSTDRSRDHSRENSPSHSDTYYTYTPVSETSKEMSNYTLPRDPSRHTISTTADTHALAKDHSVHSVHSVRDLDTFRRTTPV